MDTDKEGSRLNRSSTGTVCKINRTALVVAALFGFSGIGALLLLEGPNGLWIFIVQTLMFCPLFIWIGLRRALRTRSVLRRIAQVRYPIAYGVTLLLTGLSYWSVRNFVVAQEPPETHIVVSNLTLNFVLFALLIGAFVPSVTRRLFSKAYKRMLVPTAIAMGLFLILILRTLGYDMRF